MSQAAAQAGKHVFCEKPISLDLEQIDETLAIVKKGQGLSFRSVSTVDSMRVSCADPRSRYFWRDWRAAHHANHEPRSLAPPPIEYVKVSGGIFLDMTIHDFDMARYLIGGRSC